jgi:hypothetical protein
MTEALDIGTRISAAYVPVMGVQFVVCWRGNSRRQRASRDHQQDSCLAASTHFSSLVLAVQFR